MKIVDFDLTWCIIYKYKLDIKYIKYKICLI